MAFTPQQLYEVLVEKFDENEDFSRKFGKRKVSKTKTYYNLDTEHKETCIPVNYIKSENKLEMDIYFFERREDFERLKAQKAVIEANENVKLSFEVRAERTQRVYIRRLDINPDGDREYLEELVKWIQDTALFLCYINEKYGCGKDVSRPGTTTKVSDIHEPMLPKEIVEEDNDFIVTCGKCREQYRKAKRCTFCGQALKWPEKDELSKYLIRRDGNKRQLLDADDWATVTSFDGINRQQALEIVKSFTDIGFEYHVGTADLMMDYKSDNADSGFCGIMLFGKGEAAGIQPSEFFEYVQGRGKERKIVESFLVDLVPYLSPNQKNKPYDNEKGYYYISFRTLYSSLSEIVMLYSRLLSEF